MALAWLDKSTRNSRFNLKRWGSTIVRLKAHQDAIRLIRSCEQAHLGEPISSLEAIED
jgi:hypothetical protein